MSSFRTPQERLDAILSAAPDGILIGDAAGRIVLANDQLERMVGYRRDELIGQTVEMLVPERLRVRHAGQREAFVRDPHARPMGAGRDLMALTKDGRELPVEISLAPLVTDEGVLVVNIIRDVTERRRLEAELKHRNDELTAADRRKDEFLAVLSHELRNPLAPIRAAVEVLAQTRSEDADVHWARDVIARQVTQMVRLIDDLLDVSRISQGKIRLHRERVPLSGLIASAVETVRPLLESRRQILDIAQPPEDVVLDVDPIRIAQVISNLINNAAKYSDESTRIRLGATVAGENLEVCVRDDGIGIPAEFLPRLFETFAQADRSLDRSRGGLGIGLTLVKTLVEMHGGKVEATSEGAGRGSEFRVTLPKASPGAAPAASAPAGPHAADAGHRRVLVADDNVDFADSMQRLLRRRGYDVKIVHDGVAALAAAPGFVPDVCLLDIGLPGISGYELARELRRTPALEGALIIAISGYGRDEDRARAKESGFDEHLTKPIQMESLEAILKRSGGRG